MGVRWRCARCSAPVGFIALATIVINVAGLFMMDGQWIILADLGFGAMVFLLTHTMPPGCIVLLAVAMMVAGTSPYDNERLFCPLYWDTNTQMAFWGVGLVTMVKGSKLPADYLSFEFEYI